MTRVEQTDGLTVVTMAHGKASALDLEFCRHLTGLFERLGTEPEPVVLTGQGHIFSAGVDLLRMLDEGVDYTRAFLAALAECLITLLRFPRPLVAAINGHAIAGGCLVACTADHRIMAEGKGRIGIPELQVGVPFPEAALEIARFKLPPGRFEEVIYGGANYLPEEALAKGLVDEIAAPDKLMEAAAGVAFRYGRLNAEAFRLSKAQVRGDVLDRVVRNQERYGREILEAWTRPDTERRIRAYVEATFKKTG